jgi:squalene-hopene/tetraprenyl-beta-curcumene cyclase
MMEQTHARLVERLLASRAGTDHWTGELSSSALSTATAVVALAIARRNDSDLTLADRGLRWLAAHQNEDGGWGDTIRSKSNISTTALCWAALSFSTDSSHAPMVERCEDWLRRAAGSLHPQTLSDAISARYGRDRTFSAPILTTLTLSNRLGVDGWRLVPQLPFELAACPPQWFQWLQLPVVSYALPALIAIGQVRHHHRSSRNFVARVLRDRLRSRTATVLRRLQPSTGGYLEATPLTSFVAMSLGGMNAVGCPVLDEALRFLRHSIRDDGSWPIDSNLATWVTTLAINGLAAGDGTLQRLSHGERAAVASWLLNQQHCTVHPYTNASPGGWAWTPLPGGVPDADDTASALLALHRLQVPDARITEAARLGVQWLLDLQNRDGGIPTFCRGWGALPFDRSAPDLTAHALLAWSAWRMQLPTAIQQRIDNATSAALAYLASVQRLDGSWLPLWFGNQHAQDDTNPTYGTSHVVSALAIVGTPRTTTMLDASVDWLRSGQNGDGGWGGDAGVESSIEETAFAVDALAAVVERDAVAAAHLGPVLARGASWLVAATRSGELTVPTPVGLYFAKLWYFEALYPLIFASGALGRAIRATRKSGVGCGR